MEKLAKGMKALLHLDSEEITFCYWYINFSCNHVTARAHYSGIFMKTFLAIGDEKDFDSFNKFVKQQTFLTEQGFFFKTADYNSVFRGELPEVKTKNLVIFLFFPFDYWEKHIETKKCKDIYGSYAYFLKFKKFWEDVNNRLTSVYKDKKIHFINSPDKVYLGRDKQATKRILAEAGVQVPKSYSVRDYKKVLEMLDEGKKLFIKVKCGSMGKGISYFEKTKWLTNFRFKSGQIISKKADRGWEFIDITGNHNFLKELLSQDILIEEAIEPSLIGGRIFDLRIYVAFGEVIYIYPRSNHPNLITTSISQGARGESQQFIHDLPPELLKDAIKKSIKAAKAMEVGFAGIDVLPNNGDNRATVIEVNSFPGFPKAKSFNLSKYLMKEILKQKWD